MPDETETAQPGEPTAAAEGQGFIETVKNVIGLGDNEPDTDEQPVSDDEPEVADEEPEVADEEPEKVAPVKVSDHDAAKRSYHSCAGENLARKQALKDKRAG